MFEQPGTWYICGEPEQGFWSCFTVVPSVAQAINQIELFTTGIFCVAGFSSLFLNYCKAVLGSDIPHRSCAWRGICTSLVAVNKTAL